MGDPSLFALYGSALAVTLVAAIFSQNDTMRFAAVIISLSWILTRLWRMAVPELTAGYIVIDFALFAAFFSRWRNNNDGLAKYLAVFQLWFLILHVLGMMFDLSGNYFGRERSDYWVQAFWRNRIFEVSLLFILTVSAACIAINHSRTARRGYFDLIERHRRLKRTAQKILLAVSS